MIKCDMQITAKNFAIEIDFFVVKFNEKMFIDKLIFNARDFAFFKLIDDDNVLNEQKISNNDEYQIRIVAGLGPWAEDKGENFQCKIKNSRNHFFKKNQVSVSDSLTYEINEINEN